MTPDASTTTPLSKPNLLADLESRQDELLRLLGELEERTKQALANLTASAQHGAVGDASSKSAQAPSAPATPLVVAGEVQKSERAPVRTRSRKAA